MNGLPFSFEHWLAGIIAAAACAAVGVIAARRRPAVPRATLVLVGAGCVLLALAAGGLTWLRPAGARVAVYLDLSPSTRGAAFRQNDELTRRVTQLFGNLPYDLISFADGPAPAATGVDSQYGELPARRTVLPPSHAPAILLFSDGRFAEVPSVLPPVYAIIDPLLERPDDAAVTSLATPGDEAIIGVRNSGDSARPLALQGVIGANVVDVRPGAFSLGRRMDPQADSISATFAPGDRWPENDSLRTTPPPPAEAQRWWVRGSPPDAGWRVMEPSVLPIEAAAYLGTAVLVLDNVPAAALDGPRRAAIDRYVHDLGGGLLILGGSDRAFGAGGYAGTLLDVLSPLASTPPEPTTHWVLLADASGSMNQPGAATGGSRTRWQYAADAVAGVAGQLPPADLLSVGSFADHVRWWSRNTSVADTRGPLPPSDHQPRGRTNLEAALGEVASTSEPKFPTQLVLATDAQATITGADELAALLKSRRITLHVLLIGERESATGLAALKSIIATTGGTVRAEQLPENWAAGLRELLRAAQTPRLEQTAATVRWLGPLATLPDGQALVWNLTWPKSTATRLAEADRSGERVAMAAEWSVGEGRVTAAAFAPNADALEAMVRRTERPGRDPRFRVTWDAGSTLRVAVDATDGSTYLNGERLSLELTAVGGAALAAEPPLRRDIPQTAPGRYELAIDAPAESTIARVRRGDQTLGLRAVAGRYPAEFDAVGNDRAALAALARRTGGAVIEPGVTRPLDLPRPRRPVRLVSFLVAASAALVAAGLIRWRFGS